MIMQGLNINFLESYERMGKVLVECISGCSCTPTIINGHIKDHFSQTQAKCIIVTESPDCVVRITVQQVRGRKRALILRTFLVP